MKTLGYVALTLASLFVMFVASGYAWQAWEQHHTFYPSKANETAFLRTYDPEPAIKPFKADESSSTIGSIGDSAGKDFVRHERSHDYMFVMRDGEWPDLMTNVNTDLKANLLQSGAKILRSSGNPSSRFHSEYAADQSLGVITIAPQEVRTFAGARPPKGLKDVGIRIAIEEKWFPATPTRNQALAAHP